MIAKRLMDLALVIPGLLILLPFFAVTALLIKRDSPGPVFFRQQRVGRMGRPFAIFKFRTMVEKAEQKGLQITVGRDPRITKTGAWLRRFKLDELPQLINVLRGEMSLVGPRPEVPRYVDHYPENMRELVLSVPPGITDNASLVYKDEGKILAAQQDPEQHYIQVVLPKKLALYAEYVRTRTLIKDFTMVVRTVLSLHK